MAMVNRKRLPLQQAEPLIGHLRWFIQRDLPEALNIDRDTFGAAAWKDSDFLHFLRLRNCIGMVIEQGERVLGYIIYTLHKSSLTIERLAVDPRCRRRTLGQQLLERIKSKLSTHCRNRVRIDVADTEDVAHLCLKASGFEAVRVLRGGHGERDRYRFVYRVPASEERDCTIPVRRREAIET